MRRLDPVIERAVRAAFRTFDARERFDHVDDVDEFVSRLAREIEREVADEARRTNRKA